MRHNIVGSEVNTPRPPVYMKFLPAKRSRKLAQLIAAGVGSGVTIAVLIALAALDGRFG
jgi:hypothetical protein